MILHFFLNSLLVFFILTMLIDFFLSAFQVKNSRVRSICRMIPILKLPIDMLFFVLLGFADTFFVNLNPFSCEIYLQKLILSILPSSIQHELSALESFIVPKYISEQIPAMGLKVGIALFLMMSGILIFRKICHILQSKRGLAAMFNQSSPCLREIANQKLKSELANLNVVVLTSDQVTTPMAAYQHYIFVPKLVVENFSQEEFDAVIAHELEHLKWKDPVLKLFYNVITTLFWWVPTIWWLQKLEADQEEASDYGLRKYGIDPLSLATALIKVIDENKYAKMKYSLAPTCGLNSSKSSHLKRFENLVNSDQIKRNLFDAGDWIGCGLSILVSICFWMC